MGMTTPLSPALGGGSRRDDTGGQLLRELEALSQALYNAGQHNGRPPLRKETPSSPYLGSLPGPRRQDSVSPHLGGRGGNQPPSPYLGGRRESRSDDPPSPYLGSYGGRRESGFEDPPSPYLGGYGGRRDSRPEDPPSPYLGARRGVPLSPYRGEIAGSQNEPKSSQIVSLSGAGKAEPKSPHLARLGSRREGGCRPPLIETISPYLAASTGFEASSPRLGGRRGDDEPPSPYREARRSEEPRSPHLGGRRGDQHEPPSPNLRSRRSEGSPYLGSMREEPRSRYLSRIEETGNPNERDDRNDRNERNVPSPLGRQPMSPHLGRPEPASEAYARSGGITPLTLASAAAALRSPQQKRPPAPSRSFSSPVPTPSKDKWIEIYRLDAGRESAEAEADAPDRGAGALLLQPWHSQGFEKNLPEVTNFPAWLEDNLQFSKKLEAPKEKKSLWNWKPFRALSHIGQHRFNCMFTVHVHGIEGLPAAMNGLRLTVSWKRKEVQAQTMPSRVFQGAAEFEETLNLKSTVYGTKSGSHGMKYMPKNFDLAVVALDVDELVLGKHRLDLSRLLPESADEKPAAAAASSSDDDDADRTWTTSFKLAGKAKGGTLIVTFGSQLLTKDFQPTNSLASARFSDSPLLRPFRSFSSVPSSPLGATKGGGVGVDGRASNVAEYSPAMSEFPADMEYMSMEHLSLDDDGGGGFSSGGKGGQKSSQRGQTRPEFPGSPKQIAFYPPPRPLPGGHDEERRDPRTRTSDEEERRDFRTRNSDEEERFSRVQNSHEEEHILRARNSDEESRYSDAWNSNEEARFSRARDSDEGERFSRTRNSEEAKPSSRGRELEEEERSSRARRSGYGDEDEEMPEFTVVHRGHEVSTISDLGPPPPAPQYDDPEADEDTVEGLADEDVAPFQAHVGIDVSDNMGVEPEVEALQAAPLEKKSQAASDAEAVDVSIPNALPPKLEDACDGDDGAPADDGESDREIEGDSVEGEDDAVEAAPAEPSSEEVVKDLADLSRSWSAGFPAAAAVVQEHHAIRREEPAAPAGDKDQDAKDISVVSEEIKSKAGDNEGGGRARPPPIVPASMQEETKAKDGGAAAADDDFDLVAGEFLSFLDDEIGSAASSESGEDSPRAQLLQLFEREALIEGGSSFHLLEGSKQVFPPPSEGAGEGGDWGPPSEAGWGSDEDAELAAVMDVAEAELQRAMQAIGSKTRAKMLEDAEIEALMQEWGLNARAFEPSGRSGGAAAGSAIVPVYPAAWGRGSGPPALRIGDGKIFPAGSGGQRLLIQAPTAEIGATSSSSMHMLRRMAAAGMEELRL